MGKYNSGAFAGGVLVNGTAVVVSLIGCVSPVSVWVNPAVGDTVKTEYRVDAAAPWVEITDISPATSYKDCVIDGPVSDLRFTRTAGAGTTSAYGVA